MKSSEWLIVGLGNPGEMYSKTRHNIGWMVAFNLVEKYGAKLKKGSSIYFYSEFEINKIPVTVLIPTTYMNGSGEAISKVAGKIKIPEERILVICDEYNFPLGKIHIKSDGSDGGHNGVSSVIEELGASNFIRLRCGIGKNFPPGGMVDYVLSNFSDTEIAERDLMIQKSTESIEYLVKNGIKKAMTDINSQKLWLPPVEVKKESSISV